MRYFALVTLLLVFPLAFACARVDSGATRAALRGQLDEEWKYWMEQYPEAATLLGYPGQNARWTDYSQGAIDARAAYLKKSLERLRGLNRAHLEADDQLNYDLYQDLLQTAVEGLRFHNDAMPLRFVTAANLMTPVNQMGGVQQEVPRLIGAMPAATKQDYENIIARLRGVRTLVDQTIALMERGLAAGYTPPAVVMRNVPDQAAAQVVGDPLQSPLLDAFRRFPPAIPAAERPDLTRRATDAYVQVVRPAFEKLRDFLGTRYLPACRQTTAASALPDGASFYAYNVKWHTTTAMSPQQIHEVGLAEVKRLRAGMDKVIAASGFTGSYDEFVRFLRTDPRFYFTDADALVTAYRDIAKRADPELAPLFGRLPQSPYGVKVVPEAAAPSQTTAYYEPGAFKVGRPGYMFANTYKLEMRPKWEMEALTLHEAVPGHHLQISLAQELEGIPEFRKNSSYTAYVEGWGLYAESLGEEMGFYKDPYSKFGQLTYEMWRAVRLVVDTGLHSMNWTRQQAIDFFMANAAKTEQDIIVEVDRYIAWPGQALGYKLGQMKFRELRAATAQQMGERFDVRKFHDVVLGDGALPLDVLESRVKAWAAR
ncbi:MAG TPA: DUF885 domain-containing protein [Vicinamibacterales bacterium]|nr:DUF885 domain-containing protein [Vicinamibacterales bacterium]